MSGVGTGIALAAGIGAAGSIGGAAMQSSAAQNAASTQAQAARYAAQLQAELGQENLQYQSGQYGNTLAMMEPYLQAGYGGLANLQYLLGIGGENGSTPGVSTQGQTLSIPGVNGSVNVPGINIPGATVNKNLGAYGSLMSAYPGGDFHAPTAEEARQTPGYQFGLQQGTGALQAAAAARGDLLTGGTMNALDQYAQNYADTNYNNVYNQALQTHVTNYNQWANNQATKYNELAALAGLGQTSAQQLSLAGMQSANQVGNTLTTTGQQIGQGINNAAAATASGYIGSGNAWGGALNNLGGSMSQLAMLYQMANQNSQVPTAGLNIYNGL